MGRWEGGRGGGGAIYLTLMHAIRFYHLVTLLYRNTSGCVIEAIAI